MNKAETPKGAFTWTGRQDGFAMSAYPLGEDRLIFLEEIVRQIEAARPLPSRAIRAEIIKALEGAPIPAYRMGQSLGAESLEDYGYGYVTAARAEELKSEYLAELHSWRRKWQEAHEERFYGWRRRAGGYVPSKPVEIDYDQFICPPGFPSLIRRLKLEWLREGNSGRDNRLLIKFVAIKLTDADRLLGHLLPAAAPEQVMPLAPEPVTAQTDSKPAGASGLPENVHAALVKLAAEIVRPGPTHEQMRLVYRLGIEVDGKPKSGSRGRGRFNVLAAEILGRKRQTVSGWRSTVKKLSASPVGAMFDQPTPSAARSSASTPKQKRA